MENYLEDPYDMDKFFRNFENPLEFSANENIVRLKENYEQCKAEMEEEQKKIAEFSKTIYKKIITQDNDYSFKADSRSTKGEDIEILFNKKNLKASSHAEIVKLSSLKLSDEKEFRHNESEEIEGEESVSKVGVKFSF